MTRPNAPDALARLRAANLAPVAMAGTVVIVLVFAIGQVTGLANPPVDFEYYWQASADLADPYGEVFGLDAWYVYPPPLAQALALVRPLGADVLIVVWEAALAAALAYVARGWSLAIVAVGLAYLSAPVEPLQPLARPLGEILSGNVQWLLIACIVAGFRWPVLWAFPILTKLSPAVGLLWFAARREWRQLGLALGAVAAITAVSFAIGPAAWLDWFGVVAANWNAPSPVEVLPVPLAVRLPIAVALLVWGARTDRRWTVAAGVGLASPLAYAGWVVTMALAAVLLWSRDRARRTESAHTGPESAANPRPSAA